MYIAPLNDDFDLILCDLSMPTMSGMRLYEEIRSLNEALLPRIVDLSLPV